MKYITGRHISLAFGLPFVAVGFLGFIPNPVVSPSGLFEVNSTHNLLHVAVGAIFIIGAMLSEMAARRPCHSHCGRRHWRIEGSSRSRAAKCFSAH